MSTSSRQESLLAAIQRKGVPAEDRQSSPESAAAQPPAKDPGPAEAVAAKASKTAAPVKKRRIGKPVQFWLHEEDRRIVRELSAWLAGQGIRPSDSMVVRAALRMAKIGPGLLDAYGQAAALDGRLRSRS